MSAVVPASGGGAVLERRRR